MYPHQAERLTGVLDREGLDALVATTPENVYYLTGFTSLNQAHYRGSDVYAIFTRRGTALVVSAVDVAAVAAEAIDVDHVGVFGRFTYGESGSGDEVASRIRAWMAQKSPSAAHALASALDALGVARGTVGLDEGRLSPPGWRRLGAELPGAKLVETAQALISARAVKAPWEIECLQRALGIAEESLDAVIQMLKPGVTEREAAELFATEVRRRGARPSRAIVTTGVRTGLPSVSPSDRAARARELCVLDVGCTWRGYAGEVARTAVTGEPEERQEKLHWALQAGVEAALGAIAPGAGTGAVFDAAMAAVHEAGLPGYQRFHVGHGIGLEPYERPKLGHVHEMPLEAGMIFIVETPYFEPGWGGLSLRETVLVVEGGGRVLNRSLRGLVVLD